MQFRRLSAFLLVLASHPEVTHAKDGWGPPQGTRLVGEANHGLAHDVVWFPTSGWRDGNGSFNVIVKKGMLVRSDKPDSPSSMLHARVEATDLKGATVTFEITKISTPPILLHGHPDLISTRYYTLRQVSPTPAPDTDGAYCERAAALSLNGADVSVDDDGGIQAVPVNEVWDKFGFEDTCKGRFTMACTSGVIAKCYRWGYQGWQGPKNDLHGPTEFVQACTRMAMADYCGDGMSHTMPGTPIDIFDAGDKPAHQENDSDLSSQMGFETAWRGERSGGDVCKPWYEPAQDRPPSGAFCLSKKRWDTIPLPPTGGSPAAAVAGAVRCPKVKDPRTLPRSDVPGPDNFCDYVSDGHVDFVALKNKNALLFNQSMFIDSLLTMFRTPGNAPWTTSRFVDSGVKGIGLRLGQPGSPPPAPPAVFPLRPSQPLGSVFTVVPPKSIVSEDLDPLTEYVSPSGEHTTTTLKLSGQTDLGNQGFIYRCKAGPPPPDSIPLYRYTVPATTNQITTTQPPPGPAPPCITSSPSAATVLEGYLPILGNK